MFFAPPLDATSALLELGAKQLTSMEGVSPLLLALQYRHPIIALRLLDVEDALVRAHVNTPCPQDGTFPLFMASLCSTCLNKALI